MEFRELIKTAKKNCAPSRDEKTFYRSTFSPPKKISKEKKISENIKKFLEKREQEDRERENRDKNSKNTVKKMLKVPNSADKAVLADIPDANGLNHFVHDDFGHTSTEAEAYYAKYIARVADVKTGFASSRPKSLNANVTKGRRPSSNVPTVVHSKSNSSSPPITFNERKEREQKAAKNAKTPQPMDFKTLITLASQLQHKPVAIANKTKESERPLTMKQKREAEEHQRRKDARDQAAKATLNTKKANSAGSGFTPSTAAKTTAATTSAASEITGNGFRKKSTSGKSDTPKSSLSASSPTSAKLSSTTATATTTTPTTATSTATSTASASALPISGVSKNPYGATGKRAFNGITRDFPPRDMKTVTARQFPPADVRRDCYGGEPRRPNVHNRRPAEAAFKRRIEDDDDSEYDSELDDFIDDDDCGEDYSSHIKSIFGYDKSKYRHIDEEDDRGMVSTFAQQQREEFLSKKAAEREDQEELENKTKEKKCNKSNKKKQQRKQQKTTPVLDVILDY